jgi:hypothetical protein
MMLETRHIPFLPTEDTGKLASGGPSPPTVTGKASCSTRPPGRSIQHALIHLVNGETVTGTAILCGWANPTSFIEAFTTVLGQTPGRYQSDLRLTR